MKTVGVCVCQTQRARCINMIYINKFDLTRAVGKQAQQAGAASYSCTCMLLPVFSNKLNNTGGVLLLF